MATGKQVIRVTNSNAHPIEFSLEPWGEVYEMPSSATFEVVAEGPEGGRLEVEVSESTVVVYGWTGSVVWLYSDGKELGASVDGSPRSPPPAVPEGMTMASFVRRTFRETGDSP